MTIDLVSRELWQLLLVQGGLIAVGVGVLVKVGHALLTRFANDITGGMERLGENLRDVERDLTQFKLEVLRDYWRREDAIRNQSELHIKIDNASRKIDKLAHGVARLLGRDDASNGGGEHE